MITLSNGHAFKYMVASGALGFNPQKGWLWDRPLIWLGLIKPELFTAVIKTLTRYPRRGNLRWWNPLTWLPFSPWSCVRFLPGGAVNKVGLTNKGFDWWCEKVAPKIDFKKYSIVVSIWGTEDECVEMAIRLNAFDLVGIEYNDSCPNTGHELKGTEASIRNAKAIKAVTRHPLIHKASVNQDYTAIARNLVGVAEAISLNSVPWERAFPNWTNGPLWELEKKVGGGGGGVSGKPAQHLNWLAVRRLVAAGSLPVIAPSIMDQYDFNQARLLGARAFSFGAIHLRTPWKPTTIVKREMRNKV